jgi:N-acetylmuramoyl-L-alanine amidase
MFFILKRRSFISVILFCTFCLAVGIYAVLTTPNRVEPTISWIMAEKTILIDPGHGGTFPGRVNEDNVLEKDINLQIALKLEQYLTETGANVLLSRRTDTDLVPEAAQKEKLLLQQRADIEQRVQLAAQSNADYMLSIHCNSIPDEKWSGAQVFFNPDDEESKTLAKAIQASLNQHLEENDREALPREDTYLFKNAATTTIIIECGFLSNPDEAANLQDDAYQSQLAWAVYLGLQDYLIK